MNTVNIQDISVTDQVRNLPNPLVEKLKSLFETGEITMPMMLVMLQEKGLIADGVKYHAFRKAMAKVHKFKQREQYQSHGFLADSEKHMALWDWKKNDSDGIDPRELTLGSGKSAWFLCKQGKHNSERRIIRDHIRGHGCSRCASEIRIPALAEANSTPQLGESLAELMPEIAEQYMDWLNKRPATMVTPGVIDDAWWMPLCGEHNEYQMAVKDRTKKPEDYCPYCDMSSKYEKYWYDLVSDFLNPLGIKVFANQHILEPSKDVEMLSPGIPQGPEVDIWIPYLNYGIEINTKKNHDKEKGTKTCPLGYERNKSFRAMIQRVYLDHVWQVDHEANPEQEEARVLNSLRVAMHQKGMPIAVDWQYSGDWSDSK